jgi:hypothetical protein
LANIAEDQHHIRRSRAYAIANAAPRKGEIAYALGRLARRRCRGRAWKNSLRRLSTVTVANLQQSQ